MSSLWRWACSKFTGKALRKRVQDDRDCDVEGSSVDPIQDDPGPGSQDTEEWEIISASEGQQAQNQDGTEQELSNDRDCDVESSSVDPIQDDPGPGSQDMEEWEIISASEGEQAQNQDQTEQELSDLRPMVEICVKEAPEEHGIHEPHLSCPELQEDMDNCDTSEGLINSQNATEKHYEPSDDPQDEAADNHPSSDSEYHSQYHTLEHSCSFVDDPIPDDYKCPICQEALDQPMLVSCCGIHYCKGCIEQAQDEKFKKYTGNKCPMCREEFTVLLDKGVQRKILNLQVICKHQGCQWKGKYKNHPAHVNNGCPMKQPAAGFVASTADTGKDLQIQLRYTPLTTLDELVLAKELKTGLCLLPPTLVAMVPLPPKMHLDTLMTPHFKVTLIECAAALMASVESTRTQRHISPAIPPKLGELCHHSMLPVQSIASNLGQCTAVQSLKVLAMHACFAIVASSQHQRAKLAAISLGSNGFTGSAFLSGECRASMCMEAFTSILSHLPTYVKECLAQLAQPANTFGRCVRAYTQLQSHTPTPSSSICVPYTRTCIVAPSQDWCTATCIVAPGQDWCAATCIVAPGQDWCTATCIIAPGKDWCTATCIIAPGQDWCAATCIVAPSQDWCAATCIIAPSQDWYTATCIVAPSQDWCTSVSVNIVAICACITSIAPSQGQPFAAISLKVQAMHARITVTVSSHGWRYTAITVKVQAMHVHLMIVQGELAKDTAAFLSSQLQSHVPTSPSRSCIPYTRRATVSSTETHFLVHATEVESMIFIREVNYQSIQQVRATGLKYWSFFRFVQCYKSHLADGQLQTEVTQNLFVAQLAESYCSTLFFASTAFYTVQFGRKIISNRYTCFDESKSSPCGNNQPTRQLMMLSQSPFEGYKQTPANLASKQGVSFSYHPNLLHRLMACGASLTNSALLSPTKIVIQTYTTLPRIEELYSCVAQTSLHFEELSICASPEGVPHKCKQQQKQFNCCTDKVSDIHANWPDNFPKLPQFSKSSLLSSQARARHLTPHSLKCVKHQITGHYPKLAQSKTVPTPSRHTSSRQPPISTYQPAYKPPKYKRVNKKKHHSFSLPHSSFEPVHTIPRTKDPRVKRGKVVRKITRRTFKTTTYTHTLDNIPTTTYEPLNVTLVKNPSVLSCPIGQGSPSNSKSSSKDGKEGSHQQSASSRRSLSRQRSTSSCSGSGGSDDEDDGEKRTPKRQCEDDKGHYEERNTKEKEDEKGTPKRQCNGPYGERSTEASEDELNSEFKAHDPKAAEREEPDKLDNEFKDDRNATELGEDKKAITRPRWALPTLKTDSIVPGHKTGARAAVDGLPVPQNLDQDLNQNQHESVKQQELLIESPSVGKSEAVSSIQPLHSPPVTPDGVLKLDFTAPVGQLPNIGHRVDTVSDKDPDKNAEDEEPICETNSENRKSALVLPLPPQPLSKGEEDSLESVPEKLPSPVQPFREDAVGDVHLQLKYDKQHPVERLETNVLPHEGSTSFISKSEPVAGRISLELNDSIVVGLFPSPQQHGFISELGSDSEQSVNDTSTEQLQSNDCQTENENKQPESNSKQPSVEIESTSHNTGSSFEGHGVFGSIQCFENDARSSPDLENLATNTTPLPDTHGPAHKSKVVTGTFPRHHRQSDPHSVVVPGPLPFSWQNHNGEIKDVHTSDGAARYEHMPRTKQLQARPRTLQECVPVELRARLHGCSTDVVIHGRDSANHPSLTGCRLPIFVGICARQGHFKVFLVLLKTLLECRLMFVEFGVPFSVAYSGIWLVPGLLASPDLVIDTSHCCVRQSLEDFVSSLVDLLEIYQRVTEKFQSKAECGTQNEDINYLMNVISEQYLCGEPVDVMFILRVVSLMLERFTQ